MKMRHYGLSAQRVKRVIRNPYRTEEGIVERTVAIMQPQSTRRTDGKEMWKNEIWVMYKLSNRKIRIISAWRYPGVSPKRDPIPEDILKEIRSMNL